LSFSQQAVQSGHAIWLASQAFSHSITEHPHFCLCSVRDETRLLHDLNKIQKLGIQVVVWREPDRNNELTAFCTEPISSPELRHHFRNFQLLKSEVSNALDCKW